MSFAVHGAGDSLISEHGTSLPILGLRLTTNRRTQ